MALERIDLEELRTLLEEKNFRTLRTTSFHRLVISLIFYMVWDVQMILIILEIVVYVL